MSVIKDLDIEYAVAIRSNHGVWLPKEAIVRANKWRKFEHIRWDEKKETRYIREIIYGKSGCDPQSLSAQSPFGTLGR